MAYNRITLRKIYDRTTGYCHICKKKLSFKNYNKKNKKGAWEVEHSRPRSKGGSDHLNNLYASCISCNQKKGTFTSRTARSWNNRRKAPLSKEKRKEAKCSNAVIGGIAGGVGSALADILLGYAIYAPATLIIKGLEGFIIGVIANPRKNYQKFNYRDIIAVIVGGLIMVFGYFIYELILFGFPAALVEFFLNSLIQFGLSAIIALIFTRTLRKKIIDTLPEVFEKVFIIEVPEK